MQSLYSYRYYLELLNSITEKEKLLNIQNDEISLLKQRLDSLNEKGIIIINYSNIF